MGDLELSLDDIIKKKFVSTGINRNRNNGVINKKPTRRLSDQNNRNVKNASGKAFSMARGSIAKNLRGPAGQTNVSDARLKIIQKQRSKIKDAREKIGQVAKPADARLRLLKLRELHNVAQIGMLRKTIPDEQILQRTIGTIPTYEDELMEYTNDVAYMTRNYPERLVSDTGVYNFQYKVRQDIPVLYRTVENDLPLSRLYDQDQNSYSWTNRKASPALIDDLSDIPIKRVSGRQLQLLNIRNEDRRDESPWEFDEPSIVITKKVKPLDTVGILKRSPITRSFHDREGVRILKESPPSSKGKGTMKTLSERFCQDGNASSQKISLLKARLESSEPSSKMPNDRGISVQEPVGHRIVVSNLVPSVTHEDVKELFEDIGELISSKVVRPGTAEVVYKLHKDAVKAVDVYHNRQLDGQPMKCLLVNNRSSFSVASKASKLSERRTSKGVVELDLTALRKALHKKSTS